MKLEKSCGAVVYKNSEKGLLFLIEHMIQGHTSIPKGHVENNETEEETALREIKEETNLEVKLDTNFRHTISYSPAPNIMKDVIFFVAESTSEKLINQECEVTSLEWMDYQTAYEALTFDSDKETLRLAKEYLDK